MKTAGVMMMLVLVVAGMTPVESGRLKKRFLTTSTYDTAKEAFDKEGTGVDFDKAVDALIPYIHSDMTVFACTAACMASASSFLGPAALLSGVVCPPLCDGALAKLEETAG